MRIVLIVPSFPKLSETFIVAKVLGLLEQRYEIHVVCDDSSAEMWSQFPQLLAEPNLKQRVHVNWPSYSRWRFGLLFLYVLGRCLLLNPKGTLRYLHHGWSRFKLGVLRRFFLDARIIECRPDLVHFEFGSLAVDRMYVRDILGCKITVSFRGYDINYVGLQNPTFYSEVWANVDGIHFLGKDLWLRAQQRGCPSNKAVALIAPAINTSFFTRLTINKPDGILKILSVGRLEWKKGYEYALKSIELVRKAGYKVEYRIIGDGSYFEAIAFCRHQLQLEDCVIFLGSLPQLQILEHLEWADIFLLASVSEGFCNAVLEAQSMQLPIVATDADGLSENVVNNITGLIAHRRDSFAMAERIIELADNAEMRQKMGNAGRQHVMSNFDLPKQIRLFDDFYKQVMKCPTQ